MMLTQNFEIIRFDFTYDNIIIKLLILFKNMTMKQLSRNIAI